MGQAKQRGTLAERISQAQERKDDYYGQETSLEEIIKELGLPQETEAKGYVIHLPEKDEFVAKIDDNDLTFSVAYAKIPELAMVYDEPQLAIADAKKITKHNLLVCLLLETPDQHMIYDLWANH